MKERCFDKKNNAYHYYGGRGITVCEKWLEFEAFYKDMGDRPNNKTLDRIDNDGNYCPENCRWATPFEQGSNKRDNVFLEYKGEKLIISEWSRRTGIKHQTLGKRIWFPRSNRAYWRF